MPETDAGTTRSVSVSLWPAARETRAGANAGGKPLKAPPTHSSLDSAAFRQRVAARLRSYARQDEKMLRPSDENIRVDQALAKLKQQPTCTYCERPVLLFTDARRDPAMWTFDRKENHVPHTERNVVVCCLKCNLKKRRQDTDKFLFAERLAHIVRREAEAEER